MTRWKKKTAVIGAVLAAIAISAGVAVAGGVLGSDKEKEAFLSDAAKRLDVTPAQLQAALRAPTTRGSTLPWRRARSPRNRVRR